MPRRLVDLSVALEADVPSDPEMMLPRIEYMTHAETAQQVMAFFPGLAREDLPGGEGWALERLSIYTHNGTHVDAPYHHHSTMDGGGRAIIGWSRFTCYAPWRQARLPAFRDGHVLAPGDIDAELERIGHDLRPLDIVLVNTIIAGAHYGAPDYLAKGCGMGREKPRCTSCAAVSA